MGYLHMFYGVDLERLKGIYGAKDEDFLSEMLDAQGEELEGNDEFFESEIEDGDYPDSEAALREIVAGHVTHKGAEAVYGYVLKIICEQIGEAIGDDVAAVRDHPYDSQLLSSGPPIPIPYDESDFPEIGFLAHADIPAEIERIDNAPTPDNEELAEDVDAYRATLEEALAKGVSIVSFRH